MAYTLKIIIVLLLGIYFLYIFTFLFYGFLTEFLSLFFPSLKNLKKLILFFG